MLLNPENCPGVNERRLESVNALSDEELTLEIEKGNNSRFGPKLIPVLKTALKLKARFL